MKSIINFFIVFWGIGAVCTYAQTPIFEEHFSYVTETYYANTVLPATDFDLYFDNPGWTGENVVLGAGSLSNPFNLHASPRVSFWGGATDNLTTPSINCPEIVTLRFKLRRMARWNDGGMWDHGQAKIFHAADGEYFEELATVDMPTHLLEDMSFDEYSLVVESATEFSKFRFQVAIGTNPNRFFVDDVYVYAGNVSGLKDASKDAVSVVVNSGRVEVKTVIPISELKIINMGGQTALKSTQSILDASCLSSGIYLLSVTLVDGQKEMKKIILQ